MIFIIAVTLIFIVLRFAVTVFNFISNPKLRRVNKRYTNFVSILIPVRNDEGAVLKLLQSVSRQDYQDYEVIILDDDSSDNTYAVCQAFTKLHPHFRIIRGADLPAGWFGKNFACHQLALQAKGDLLMFLNADTSVNDQLINSAVHRMHVNKLNLLSLFPDQDTLTFSEKLIIPITNFPVFNLLPIRLVFLLKSSAVAAACGQFMLFNANDYHKHQWHKNVRDKVAEDVEMMRLIKSAGLKGETLLANGLISSRSYKGFREAAGLAGKNLLAIFNYSISGFIFYMFLLIAGPVLIIATLNINLILFMSPLILLPRAMISLLSGQPVWRNLVLHPLQMFCLVLAGFLAVRNHLTRSAGWKSRGLYH